MSRVFTDDGFLTWEAYESGGRFGLPERPKLIFHCLSAHGERARFVVLPGDSSEAEEAVQRLSDAELRQLLERAEPLP